MPKCWLLFQVTQFCCQLTILTVLRLKKGKENFSFFSEISNLIMEKVVFLELKFCLVLKAQLQLFSGTHLKPVGAYHCAQQLPWPKFKLTTQFFSILNKHFWQEDEVGSDLSSKTCLPVNMSFHKKMFI